MSLHLPARRIVQTARPTVYATATARQQPSLPLQYLLPRTQRRNGWFNWGSKNSEAATSKTLSDELTKLERQEKLLRKLSDNTQGPSIFDEEIKDVERKEKKEMEKIAGPGRAGRTARTLGSKSYAREHMERALDPDPRWRIRWQKKHVAQMVRARTGGKQVSPREARDERIRLTEKQVWMQSDPLATSTKKLVHLSHQIVGKTVDDAITQMRYSKKKMAREVRYQLEEARDLAIASRGMGLGAAPGGEVEGVGEGAKLPSKTKKIQTKDGTWLEVTDPTRLYVDESWVGKGPYRGRRIQYHARGRMSMMWRPTARLAVVLKEEKTRIRQHEERVEKQAKKAPWVHLPNRPITAQRPYYSW